MAALRRASPREDLVGDGNPATSDGIFAFTGSAPSVSVGQMVLVGGTVREFNVGAATNAPTAAHTVTELGNITGVRVTGSGYTIAPVPLQFPLPIQDAMQAYEGMLVTISGPLTVQQNVFSGRFGELTLGAGGRLWTAFGPTFANAGTHTIAFGVADGGDYIDTSALSVTGVRMAIPAVPESSSLALMAAGRGLVGLQARRRRRQGTSRPRREAPSFARCQPLASPIRPAVFHIVWGKACGKRRAGGAGAAKSCDSRWIARGRGSVTNLPSSSRGVVAEDDDLPQWCAAQTAATTPNLRENAQIRP